MAIRKLKKAAMTSPRIKTVFPLESGLDDTVLSVAGGNTINLVTEYNVHSCPDEYTYRPVQYLSVRDRTSRIGMIYAIEKILIFDDCRYTVPNYVSGVINPNLYADKKLYPPGILSSHEGQFF